jgi:hypothetical protein
LREFLNEGPVPGMDGNGLNAVPRSGLPPPEALAGQAKSAGKEFRSRLILDRELGYAGPCFGVGCFGS